MGQAMGQEQRHGVVSGVAAGEGPEGGGDIACGAPAPPSAAQGGCVGARAGGGAYSRSVLLSLVLGTALEWVSRKLVSPRHCICGRARAIEARGVGMCVSRKHTWRHTHTHARARARTHARTHKDTHAHTPPDRAPYRSTIFPPWRNLMHPCQPCSSRLTPLTKSRPWPFGWQVG